MAIVPAQFGRDYLLVFVLVTALAVGTAAGGSILGAFLWGYAAWLMHKGKNDSLAKFFKTLVVIQLTVGVLLALYLASAGDDLAGETGFSGSALLMLVIFAMAIASSLWLYFRRKMNRITASPETA